MRRSSDRVTVGINIATMLTLAGLLYAAWRNNYTDFVRMIERLQDQVSAVVKTQNDAIERIRRDYPPRKR